MAVFQGARLRNAALPASGIAARRRAVAPPVSWSPPRVRPVGLLIAAILAATMLGLVYLTQTLGSNATSSEIATLAAKSNDLRNFLRTQDWTVEVYLKPGDIVKRARAQGLRELDGRVVLPAP